MLALAANIRGVRDVKLDVVTSKERKKLDRKAASRLVKIVEDVFPGEQVRLTFFGGVAVLTGKVRKLRARRAIEEFLAGDPWSNAPSTSSRWNPEGLRHACILKPCALSRSR